MLPDTLSKFFFMKTKNCMNIRPGDKENMHELTHSLQEKDVIQK